MSLPSYDNFKRQTLRSLNPVHNVRNLAHGDVQGALGEAQGGLAPAPPKPAPPVPQLDEANQRIAESDRLRRRRGALANIYAGNAAAPSVGRPTLGG
jgi:hypothetical protein